MSSSSSFLNNLAKHKAALIAATAAIVLLTAYVIPFDSLFGMASAAKGGNPNNDNSNNNRYKVCEKKEITGKGNVPKKCYGITG
jgi:hypothetical protein